MILICSCMTTIRTSENNLRKNFSSWPEFCEYVLVSYYVVKTAFSDVSLKQVGIDFLLPQSVFAINIDVIAKTWNCYRSITVEYIVLFHNIVMKYTNVSGKLQQKTRIYTKNYLYWSNYLPIFHLSVIFSSALLDGRQWE